MTRLSSPESLQQGTTSRLLGRMASTPRQFSGPSGRRTLALAWCAPPYMRTWTSQRPERSSSPSAATVTSRRASAAMRRRTCPPSGTRSTWKVTGRK